MTFFNFIYHLSQSHTKKKKKKKKKKKPCPIFVHIQIISLCFLQGYSFKIRYLALNKMENCTISTPKGNSYCRRKSSAGGHRFKVSSERLSTEIDIIIRSPIKARNQVRCCLTPVYQAIGCSIMPITTDKWRYLEFQIYRFIIMSINLSITISFVAVIAAKLI